MLYLEENKLLETGRDLNVVFHKILQYYTIEHTHDFYEAFLISSGKVNHIINGERQLLESGALVLIRPKDIHAYERYKEGEVEGKVSMWNFNIRRQAIEEAFAFLGAGFHIERLLESHLPPMVQLDEIQMGHMIHLLEEVSEDPTISNLDRKTIERMLLIRLLTEHFYWRNKPNYLLAPKWFNELLTLMNHKEHFTAGYSALHKLSPVSREHLIRTFRHVLGITPNEWINERRLAYAANLLKHSNEGILTIGLESGFVSISSFYKGFYKQFGQSPAKYRKQHARNTIPIK